MSDRTRTVGGVGRPIALLSAVGLIAGAACCMPALPGAPADRGLDLRSSSLPGGGQPFAVVAADFNRDGALDLAVSNPAASTISIHLGRGDGSFHEPSGLATGARPRGLVAADFDGDGAPDLATAATGAHAVSVHLGLGDGRFGEAETFAVESRPFMLEAEDLDGDGHLDLAVANEGEKTDGRGLSVLLGDGRGGFSVASFATGEHGSDVAVADFNRDGAADVAVSTWGTNDVNLHLGRGDGTFASPQSVSYEGYGLYEVLAADLDRDGNPDMVWNDIRRTSLYLLYGDGRGGFERTRLLPAGAGVRHAVAADLNGDGWPDLASANTAAGGISVMLSDGKGDFLPTQSFAAGELPRAVAAADLNGDRRPDLIVTNMKSDDLTVFLNHGPAPLRVAEAENEEPAQEPIAPLELATFLYPNGLALDPAGEYLLVSDQQNHRIARVEIATGRVATVAGNGRQGGDGDGGPAIGARLDLPADVALDREGNVFIADFGNDRVRKLDPSGTITTVAGTGEAGYSGDDGPAVAARLRGPLALVLDDAGGLYVAEAAGRIRRVDPSGTIRTVAGTGVVGGAGDGGPATKATLGAVTGLGLRPGGDLLIADQFNFRIRKIARDGTITTVAGTGKPGYAGDGKSATEALLNYPSGVAADRAGSLYIADQDGNRIRKVTPDGRIATLAGHPTRRGHSGDGGPATEALIWFPYDVVADTRGNLFFTDRYNHCIRRIDPSGIITTVAGTPVPGATARGSVLSPGRAGLSGGETPAPAPPHAGLDLAWEHTFRSGSDANAAYAVSVDENGGIYLAGDVGSGADWHVLHLGPDGEEIWSFDFDGGGVDVPFALTLTPDGQVVAAGSVLGGDAPRALVISLSRNGEENWRYEEAGGGRRLLRGIASDEDGNLYVVGQSDGRWKAVSLSPPGELRWTYEGEEGTARGVDVADGRVLIAGDARGGRRVIELDTNGKVRWDRRAGPEVPVSTTAHAVRVGSGGRAVVSGSRRLRGVHARIETLDGAGQPLWEYLDSHSPGYSIARALDVDRGGSAVVVGESASDWLLLGLDARGRLLWRFTYDGGGGPLNPDQAHAVAFHPEGGFVVAGAIHPVPRTPPTLGDVHWRVARYRVQVDSGD